MVWWKQNICVGFKNYYAILSHDRSEITMGPFQGGAGPLLPIILCLPYDQLVLTYGRKLAFIHSNGRRARPTLDMFNIPSHLAFVFPFLFCLSEHGVEVFNLVDPLYHQFYRPPAPFVHFSSDGRMVIASTQKCVYTLIPTNPEYFVGPSSMLYTVRLKADKALAIKYFHYVLSQPFNCLDIFIQWMADKFIHKYTGLDVDLQYLTQMLTNFQSLKLYLRCVLRVIRRVSLAYFSHFKLSAVVAESALHSLYQTMYYTKIYGVLFATLQVKFKQEDDKITQEYKKKLSMDFVGVPKPFWLTVESLEGMNPRKKDEKLVIQKLSMTEESRRYSLKFNQSEATQEEVDTLYSEMLLQSHGLIDNLVNASEFQGEKLKPKSKRRGLVGMPNERTSVSAAQMETLKEERFKEQSNLEQPQQQLRSPITAPVSEATSNSRDPIVVDVVDDQQFQPPLVHTGSLLLDAPYGKPASEVKEEPEVKENAISSATQSLLLLLSTSKTENVSASSNPSPVVEHDPHWNSYIDSLQTNTATSTTTTTTQSEASTTNNNDDNSDSDTETAPLIATSLRTNFNNNSEIAQELTDLQSLSLEPYDAAIKVLKSLPLLRSPRDKLGCILKTSTEITACVEVFWSHNSEFTAPILSADDFVPILEYVILSAAVPKIYSEMNYIYNFATDEEMKGKCGYAFATFQLCVEYLANGKHNSDVIAENEKKINENIDEFVLVNPLASLSSDGANSEGNETKVERKPIQAFHDQSGSFLADGLIFESIDI